MMLVRTFALMDGGNMIVFWPFFLGGGGGPIICTDPLFQKDSQATITVNVADSRGAIPESI